MTQREMTPRKLADKIAELHALVPDMPRACATALLNFAPEIIHALRTQADEIDHLKADVEQWSSLAGVREMQVKTLVDEIDALKAAAIVQGSIKLSEAAKTALQRERLAAEIDALKSQAILRGMQVKNLMAEIQRLKMQMPVPRDR